MIPMTQTAAKPTTGLESETPRSVLFFDLDSELATTRRILERVPDGNDDWRPHEKSMKISGLATHIAQLPGFGIAMLTTDEMDASKRQPDPKFPKNVDRLKHFDDLSGKFRDLMNGLTWEQARLPWKFRFGDRVIVDGPRANLIRTMVITHSTHHRAQLGVFLRLLGIPLPGSYGPSADEPNPPPR
jgi:uncharacterized damage-inducible protein DinB